MMYANQPLAHVQHSSGSGNNITSWTLSMAAQPLKGNLVIVCVCTMPTTGTTPRTVTSMSGGGCTFTQIAGLSLGTGQNVEIWAGVNASGSGGAVTTVNISGAGSGAGNVQEFSGGAQDSASIGGLSGNATISASTTEPSGTITPTLPQCLLIAAAGWSASASPATGPGGSWNALSTQSNITGPVFVTVVAAYQVLTAASALSATWTTAAAQTGCGLIVQVNPLTVPGFDPRTLSHYRR